MVFTQFHILDENSTLFHSMGHSSLFGQLAGSTTVLGTGDLCQLHVFQLWAAPIPKDAAARAAVPVRPMDVDTRF